MPVVSVDQAMPGMVLSGPVTDRRGRLLIPAGQALSDKHVNALRMWGIASLEIEGDEEVEPVVAVSSEAVEAARVSLQPLYRHADLTHPFLRQLFEYCVERKAKEIELAPAPEQSQAAPGVAPAVATAGVNQ